MQWFGLQNIIKSVVLAAKMPEEVSDYLGGLHGLVVI